MTLLPEAVLQSMAGDEYRSFLTQSKIVSTTKSVDAQLVDRAGKRVIAAVKKYYQDKVS